MRFSPRRNKYRGDLMQTEISKYNEGFINQIKRVTDLSENTIVNNIISYYRAIKTVRKQYRELEPEADRLIEFGKAEIGLLEGEELQLYLLTYLGVESKADALFYEKLNLEILNIIKISKNKNVIHSRVEETFKKRKLELVS